MTRGAKCHEIKGDALAGLRGETSSVASARVAEHLRACPECRRIVDEATGLVEAVRRERFVPTPEERERMAHGLFDSLAAEDRAALARRRIPWRRVVFVAAPAMAAAIAILAFLTLPSGPIRGLPAVRGATPLPPKIILPAGATTGVSSVPVPPATDGVRTSSPFRGLEVGAARGTGWAFRGGRDTLAIDLDEGDLLVRYTRREGGPELAVRAPGIVVRVRGTVFLVRAVPGRGTEVTVAEGRVVVERETSPQTDVGAGETLLADGRVTAVPQAAEGALRAWAARLGPRPIRPSQPEATGAGTPASLPPPPAGNETAASSDLYALAESEMAEGRQERAAGLLESFLVTAPQDPRADTARLDLARLYTGPLGRPSDARKHLEAYVEAHPEAADRGVVRDLLDRLRGQTTDANKTPQAGRQKR